MRREVTLTLGLTLLASFIAWILTIIFPQSRDWWLGLLTPIGSATMSALRWLWADVSTPRAVFWFLLLAIVGLLGRWAVSAFPGPSNEGGREAQFYGGGELPVQEGFTPNDKQYRMLVALLEAYPLPIDLDTAKRAADERTGARAEQLMEELMNAGVVTVNQRYGGYNLTMSGRDSALKWCVFL